MNFATRSLLALALYGSLLTPALAADAAAATVNGKPIKQSLMDYILTEAAEHGTKVDDNTRKTVLDKLVGSELVIQEAQKLGLDKQADYLAKEELVRRELLVNTYLADYVKKHPVSEADTKAEYEQLKKQMGDKEYSARHILVKTEQEAKDVIAQLDKGADFAKLAKDKSLDPGSKDKGGDLGWFSSGAMVQPFSDAVAGMSKGRHSKQPVQTRFGWHVIKLENVRAAQPAAYEDVKDEIRQRLQQRNLEKMLAELRGKAKIVPAK